MTITLIRGPPGIGKTTLIKHMRETLDRTGVALTGFYTEEVRDENNLKLGFDIVTVDGERTVFARRSDLKTETTAKFTKLGHYDVYVEEFEKVALPMLDQVRYILILDGINKMQLLSKEYQDRLDYLIWHREVKVFASVPWIGGGRFVKKLQKIKSNRYHQVYTLTKENRDKIMSPESKLLKDLVFYLIW